MPVELSCLKNMMVRNFQLHSSCTHLQTPNKNGPSQNKKPVHNDHKPLQTFLNGKNANNKINRWSLELATYNIKFEWISGTCNRAADCLSQLVDVKDTPAIPTEDQKDTLWLMQRMDVFCKCISKRLLSGKVPSH